jgi:hypothetical protein
MKSLRDYLEESDYAASNPVAGDTFAINIREECLIESVVVESRDDGVVIAADDRMIQLLESYGYSFEQTCMECGGSGCGCGQDPEEYGDETDAGQNPGEYDQEGDMAKDELLTVIRSARRLIGMLDNNDNMPEWTQKKITKSADYVDTAADYISSQKERGVMEGDSEPNPVARAILHRIMMQHPGLLAAHGPERVMNAVDEVVDYIGDVEEIGSSDVSGWIRHVEQMLTNMPDNLDEQGVAEFARSGSGGDDGPGDDPYKYSQPKHYSQAIDFFGQFEAEHFDKEDMDDATGTFKGYWYIEGKPVQIAYFKFDNPRRTSDRHPGMGWYYEPDPDSLEEAEYQGRKVPLGKPMQGDVAKSKVYVKDPKTGNVKKVNFGDPNMKIKKSNPARRKSFRARHNCDNPGPRTKARYWSCRAW